MINILLAAAITALPRIPTEPGTVVSLDGSWEFALFASESTETPVASGKIDVPSNWEMRGYGTPQYAKKISGESGLYRRTFEVPRGWSATRRVFLRLDGVQFGAKVNVNGRPVGNFTSSYNAHVFDVTDSVRRDGVNDLEIRTHGNPKGAMFDTHDGWTLHGVFRSVRLFALPAEHVRDWRITTRVSDGTADVAVDVETSGGKSVPLVTLFAPDGKKVASAKGSNVRFSVKNASLWTAETPDLHVLEIKLPSQTLREKVGLREVTWNATSLMVNGRPIELRGANHHDISPVNGRAVTAEEQRRDIMLMRGANCNFLRTSHYPPTEALLDACDELGMYVMDEVPFGHGRRLLADVSHGPALLERARLTLERDRNRACVIAWSVGNENPITEISVAAAELVRKTDPTRPWCFPLQPGYFIKRFKTDGLKDVGDMLNWHYPLICGKPRELREKWFSKFDRPFISGEFAHANGLDNGALETYIGMIRSVPGYVGGAVWVFQDQGILRKAQDIPAVRARHCTWPDAESAYDTNAHLGTDGIVYSDRTPQVDYFQMKKVFSPVILGDADLCRNAGASGRAVWTISVESHYDFLQLDTAVTGTWRIVSSSAGEEKTGSVSMPPVPPRGKGRIAVDTDLSGLPDAAVRWLEISFGDKRTGRKIYARSFPVSADVSRRFSPVSGAPAATKQGERVKTAAYTFSFDRTRGEVRFADAEGRDLFSGPLTARIDRRPSLAKDASMTERKQPWMPHLLVPREIEVARFDSEKLEIIASYAPTNLVGVSNATLQVRWGFSFLPDRVRVGYSLAHGRGRIVFEAGVAISLASGATRFDWIGDGPYEAYPGASKLVDFGAWSLDRRDLYFPGNRRNVRALRILSPDGSGIVVLPDGETGDFAFERRPGGGVLLGANALVSCRACRFMVPTATRRVRAGQELSGGFTVVPAPALPASLQSAVFGDKPDPVAFAPFMRVYEE